MEVEASAKPGRLLVIGNFDGVHLGHQAVLRSAAREAASEGLAATVLTFDPHPAAVLGRSPPPLLTTMERKRVLIADVSPEVEFRCWPFTSATAELSPEAFVKEVLVSELSARVVVVGQNFRFGKGRAGDLETLRLLGRRWGFSARAEPIHGDARGPFSSTRVREALARGDVEEATHVLGRPHRLTGTVVLGDRRGRTLGFPTANLVDVDVALPEEGVYCGYCPRETGTNLACVASIGRRPTVERPSAVEVHLLDFQGDLYGQALSIEPVAQLRKIQRFDDLAGLKEQIGRDVAEARRRLSL